MDLTRIIKNALGFIRARLYGIETGSGFYIGNGCKIVGRGVIKCGDSVTVRPSTHLYVCSDAEISIGDKSEIGNHSVISSSRRVYIGNGVLTAPNVYIADHNHEYTDINRPIYSQGIKRNQNDEIAISDGCWIGKNAVIVGCVHIGKNCVVGANSVVTRDVPDYCVVAGAPARIIKRFDLGSGKWLKIKDDRK